MIPENVVEPLLAPAVSVTAPAAPLVTVPAPASEPIASLNPCRSKVAPPDTVTALPEGTVLVAPSCRVPAPGFVRPAAPLVAPLMVRVVPALPTVTVRVAANARPRLMVFVPAILLSAQAPAASVRALPPRVYPLPEMVIELKLAPLKVLLFERCAAPVGRTRFSAPTPVGATPPDQLLPLVHLLFPDPPVQVNVCAAPRGASVSKATTAATAATRPRRRQNFRSTLNSPSSCAVRFG